MPISKKNRTFAVVIQLGRHIEILLLDYDCVIVPEFGGFVAHHVCARYDEDDHMWLPPMRTVGFNPQLRMNDSLLAQSYVNAYDISYPEALRRIEDEVEELQQLLDTYGSYELPDVGLLIVNSEGNLQFEPCEAGLLSPEYYGLGECEIVTLKEAIRIKAANKASQTIREPQETAEPKEDNKTTPTLLEFVDKDEQEDRAIQIKMSWVRNAVAIAAAILVFFIMATPITNSNLGNSTMSRIQGNVLYKLIPQDTNLAKATPVEIPATAKDSVATAQNTEEAVVKPAESPVVTPTAEPTPNYCIVLASQVKLSNAEHFVEQLQKQGYKSADIYIHNKTVRVVYGNYETEAQAYKELNRLTKKEEFADAWVYKKTDSNNRQAES